MATARPCVGIYNPEGTPVGSALMPSVFCAPLRADLVRFVCTNLAKNSRQAYGVAPNAGYQTSAESWGTGRAVSRIPRVPGGGTHRSGQAAFGNMCRGGGMFAPNKTWRRWHRKVNVTMKRHAVAAAVAATGLPALVMARGHKIDAVPELPLVVEDAVESLKKTKEAAKLLQHLGCAEELQKIRESKKLRAGRGKGRNRRCTLKKGPLVIYNSDDGICRAFRNIPGVELAHVDRLSVLTLAPGGTLGRFCVWTASAFKRLQLLYGRTDGVGTAALKKGYHLPRPVLQNADIARIINSDEVQSVVRPMLKGPPKKSQHKNLLTNRSVLLRVNPAAKNLKRNAQLAQQPGSRPYTILQKKKIAKREERKQHRMMGKKYMKEIRRAFEDKAAENMSEARQPEE
ncbi:60S ribosomal protein L4-B [Cyclospora cayetanensis]|uniref:Large ribosomal subunit protein uL4 n=1 Tax=Cyclospora cayetanensis TaxID=88456 RepID=A0A6P6S0D9_9EIME|nr:60S ribosomal protein L4-B [Cyclospora cayetanensis]